MILIETDASTMLPLDSAVEFAVLVLDREARRPGVSVIASLSPQRPGPYRTLVRWPDPGDVELAEDALESLSTLLVESDGHHGVIRWQEDTQSWILDG